MSFPEEVNVWAEKKVTTVEEKNLSGTKTLQKRPGEFEGLKENNVAEAQRTEGAVWSEAGRAQGPLRASRTRQQFWSGF